MITRQNSDEPEEMMVEPDDSVGSENITQRGNLEVPPHFQEPLIAMLPDKAS